MEKPILFNGPMVRAILSGAKTQTRRIAKCPRWADGLENIEFDFNDKPLLICKKTGCQSEWKAHWQVGDVLWVRETWLELRRGHWHDNSKPRDWVENYSGKCRKNACAYLADETPDTIEHRLELGYPKWTPSIHMPRWASRLSLRVTDVRCQRAQEISEADAVAEGIEQLNPEKPRDSHAAYWKNYDKAAPEYYWNSPRDSFHSLWQSLYGNWDANPWVFAATFERIGGAS